MDFKSQEMALEGKGNEESLLWGSQENTGGLLEEGGARAEYWDKHESADEWPGRVEGNHPQRERHVQKFT